MDFWKTAFGYFWDGFTHFDKGKLSHKAPLHKKAAPDHF